MIKTLRLTFSLRNTYRVNSILYSIKQIPLLKKVLPDALYRVRWLKIFANLLSVLWEVASAFLGKFLYFLLMLALPLGEYAFGDSPRLFLHILLFLTVIGAYMNTFMFNPTRDKYYAMVLLGMESRSYALVNYFYAIFKILVGFAVFGQLFGRGAGLSIGQCLLIPAAVAGLKMAFTAWDLRRYERSGRIRNENSLSKPQWAAMLLLLAAAYGLPAAGVALPESVSVAAMVLAALSACLSLRKIWTFDAYREAYRRLLIPAMTAANARKQAARAQGARMIRTDGDISSDRRGFEYLNELFIKRHRRILWAASVKTTMVASVAVLAALALILIDPLKKALINHLIMSSLPLFTFLMYCLNRGASFTQALFVNCDHSLLTYPFYKEPRHILKLYQIRLKEIVKVNLPPAAVIGGGLALLLYASGGTEHPVNYAIVFVSIVCMSVFFSMHYLTIYYLLQPYNAGTEIRSGMFRVVYFLTYFACYSLIRLKMSSLVFGAMTIAFCALYCAIASLLVYKFAPRTFRIRN